MGRLGGTIGEKPVTPVTAVRAGLKTVRWGQKSLLQNAQSAQSNENPPEAVTGDSFAVIGTELHGKQEIAQDASHPSPVDDLLFYIRQIGVLIWLEAGEPRWHDPAPEEPCEGLAEAISEHAPALIALLKIEAANASNTNAAVVYGEGSIIVP